MCVFMVDSKAMTHFALSHKCPKSLVLIRGEKHLSELSFHFVIHTYCEVKKSSVYLYWTSYHSKLNVIIDAVTLIHINNLMQSLGHSVSF
jgi:hypothetical protein